MAAAEFPKDSFTPVSRYGPELVIVFAEGLSCLKLTANPFQIIARIIASVRQVPSCSVILAIPMLSTGACGKLTRTQMPTCLLEQIIRVVYKVIVLLRFVV